MFCDNCGYQIPAGQRFCGGCGKQVGIAQVRPSDGRVSRHVQLVSILWLAAGFLNFIGAAALFIVGNTLFPAVLRSADPNVPIGAFLQGMLTVLGILVGLKALLSLAAGWGLLQREAWARPLVLVLGIVSLINIPLGTALGIYTLWVFMPAQSEQEYQRLSQAA